MLNAFIDWASEKRDELARNGFKTTLVVSDESSNPSARLDIDSETAVARITAWNSGDVDLEVINIEDETTIYSKQLSLSGAALFDCEFRDFFFALGLMA